MAAWFAASAVAAHEFASCVVFSHGCAHEPVTRKYIRRETSAIIEREAQ
jgi:hypothetical protein